MQNVCGGNVYTSDMIYIYFTPFLYTFIVFTN